METNRNKTSLVAISLLSIMLGSLLVPIGPVHAQQFFATVDIVNKATGLPGIPQQMDGTSFTVQLRIADAFDMDSWNVRINYYGVVLTVTSPEDIDPVTGAPVYTSCGNYQIFRRPSFIDNVDGVRGQIELGATYASVPSQGFTGGCVLAEIDFVIDTGAFANNWRTMIHIADFRASKIIVLGVVVPMPIGFTNDASYGSSSVRYADLRASPIRKRCLIEGNSPWSISRDGADGELTFTCTIVGYGDAYPVVAKVKLSMIDQTLGIDLRVRFSNDEALFLMIGESRTVQVDWGTLLDNNDDGLVDLQAGHKYQVNAEVVYDCNGTTQFDCAGLNDRVFSLSVRP